MQEPYVNQAHFCYMKLTFIESLKAVSTGGPASALLSYCVLGIFVYGVVISLYATLNVIRFSTYYNSLVARCLQCTLYQVLSRLLGHVLCHLHLGLLSVSLSSSYYLNRY